MIHSEKEYKVILTRVESLLTHPDAIEYTESAH